MEVVSPPRQQFLETAYSQFSFLNEEFGCHEISPDFDNLFTIAYENEHCRVTIVGRSFGFALDVGITRLDYDQEKDPYEGVFPLWAVLQLRDPELYDRRFNHTSGQLKMLCMDADALNQHCADILVGDFSLGTQIAELLRKNAKEARLQWKEEEAQWRYRRATEAANQAFHAKDFVEVVRQLEPVKYRLTASQIKKLDYARKRQPQSWVHRLFKWHGKGV